MKPQPLIGALLLAASCGPETLIVDVNPQPAGEPSGETVESAQHDDRFIGLWALESPTNAQFIATFYSFASDGTLAEGSSTFDDCSWVGNEPCVTGAVKVCRSTRDSVCTSSDYCVFGGQWRSLSSDHLVIGGHCSDDRDREILIGFSDEGAPDSAPGPGAGATLLSVDNETDWSFPTAVEPTFRKCPDGTDEAECEAGMRL